MKRLPFWHLPLRAFIAQALADMEKRIMAALDDLEAKVAAEETVIGSAVTLLQTINQELKDALANGDTARIEALSAKIDADTQNLAAAVQANTPAAPTT